MTKSENYSDLIIKTFREQAIRTVMLIDDKFPTYSDLIDNSDADLAGFQTEKAHTVYRTFKHKKIPCDIENDPAELTGDRFDHIRKSDLIVLDYHLREDNDPADAIRVLRQLADSKHFNLVVLYTAADDLDLVWLEVATCLRAAWVKKEELIKSGLISDETWALLFDENDLSEPANDVVGKYLLEGCPAVESKRLVQFFKSKSIPQESYKNCITAIFQRQISKLFGDERMMEVLSGPARKVKGCCAPNKPRWLLCGSVFIAITSKRKEGEEARANEDPEGILKCLDEALLDWHPNVLQVLVSELQNILEREPLSYDQDVLTDSATQVGWIYHVLKQSTNSGDGEIVLSTALEELSKRLFETIRDNVSVSESLEQFGAEAFKKAIKPHELKSKSDDELVDFSITLARCLSNKPQKHDVLHALNFYLSCEEFRGSHVTTGTIFCDEKSDEWWVCVTPDCDMVPRKPSDQLGWNFEIHPVRPMLALRLESAKLEIALRDAEQGRFLFVKRGGKPLCFRVFGELTRLPRPHMFLLSNSGLIDHTTSETGLANFKAHHILKAADGISPELKMNEFYAVAQLRAAYANRLLQQAGHYTSRIGVDFVSFGNRESVN
jgi:hypothetical protein